MKKLSQISPSVVPQWTPCEQCSDSPGWVPDGKVVKRCKCVVAYQQRVADALKAAGKK